MRSIAIILALGLNLLPISSGPEMQALEDEFGVSINQDVLGYSVSVRVNDHHKEVATGPLIPAADDIRLQLQTLQVSKTAELQRKYAIHIGTGGHVTKWVYGGGFNSYRVPVKAPNLRELYALENALEHSAPSHLVGRSLNSQGLNVYFLDRKDNSTNTEWGLNEADKPSMFIEPRRGITTGRTLEEWLMHQLSHNSEYRMGWNPRESWKWPTASRLGWKHIGGEGITETIFNGHPTRTVPERSAWLLRTTEAPDSTYMRCKRGEFWIRCDNLLNPLDARGQRVKNEANARRLTSDEIRPFCLVPPVSPEFDTPAEVLADGLSMFRAGAESRTELLYESPKLYSQVKTHDQKELDVTYGKGSKVRSVKGYVVDPTPEAIKEIRELEEGKAS